MSNPINAQTLRQIRFFQDVADDELSQLASLAQPETFRAGGVVFREGEPGNKMYVIVDGSVSVDIKAGEGAKRVLTVGPGELLGWSPVLKGGAMKATARVLADTQMISFDAARIVQLCNESPKLGCTVMRQVARALAERLHATRVHLLERCHHQLPDVLTYGIHEGTD